MVIAKKPKVMNGNIYKEIKEMKKIQFRDLLPQEIDLRVGATTEKGFTLLLYKDARVDMNILDETVGQFNWQKEFYQVKNTLMCKVGINVNFDNDKEPLFIYKSDAGDESNTEAIKGEASDSFKRACFNWGIGRKLYTSPFVWINKDENNDPKKSHYVVKVIEYNNKEITKLIVANEKTGQVVYSYPKGANVSKNNVSVENKGTQQEEDVSRELEIIKNYIKEVGEERFNGWLGRAFSKTSLDQLTPQEIIRCSALVLTAQNRK